MDRKNKYVRLGEDTYGAIIIFPIVIEHDTFKRFSPVSAGFCYINSDKETVECFGESVSLGLKSDETEDTKQATKQIFGVDAMLKLL